jgi:hypothetical protein
VSTQTLNDKLDAYFRAKPDVWIDGMELATVAGSYAWRSRISNLRTERGMVIENRKRTMPQHLGNCPALLAWDIAGACNCGKSGRYTVSEYRYVPKAECAGEQGEAIPVSGEGHDLNVGFQLR